MGLVRRRNRPRSINTPDSSCMSVHCRSVLFGQPVCLSFLSVCHNVLPSAAMPAMSHHLPVAMSVSYTVCLPSSPVCHTLSYVPLSVSATMSVYHIACLPQCPTICVLWLSLPDAMSVCIRYEYRKATDLIHHHRDFSSSYFLIVVCPRTSHPTYHT